MSRTKHNAPRDARQPQHVQPRRVPPQLNARERRALDAIGATGASLAAWKHGRNGWEG